MSVGGSLQEHGTAPGATLSCWTPQVAELPPPVRKDAREIRPMGTLLYPYWMVDVRIHVGRLFLPRVTKQWRAVVDGLTGMPSVLQPGLVVSERTFERGAPASPAGPITVTPFALAAEDIDRSRLQQTLWPYVSRRLRSWLNVDVEIGAASPVYKELRLFDVDFLNGSRALLALDTLTGEYGVAPPAAVAAATPQAGTGDERGEGGA
jgi:hypothetical protein